MTKTKSRPTTKASKPKDSANGTVANGDVLTLDEAAAYLRVSTDDVLQMIKAQDLPGRKFGAEWRFCRAAIQDWLSQPPKRGILRHFGRIKDDPYAEEMLRNIYKERGRPEVPDAEEK